MIKFLRHLWIINTIDFKVHRINKKILKNRKDPKWRKDHGLDN